MSDTTPQFGTAEYEAKPGTEVCKSCKQTLSGTYYRVNGILACERCVDQLKAQQPKDNHAAFVRGFAFGIGGAIAGLILYAVFGILTGLVIGYVSLAVGYIVGKAIKFGSSGIGGRRYQIAAALLTYAAVSMAAIPMGISEVIKHKNTLPPPHAQQPAPSASQTEQPAADEAIVAPPASSNPRKPLNIPALLATLAFVGLASPFLALQDPIHGLIGLVILFVGIRIAWQLTAGPKLDILGPFRTGVAVSSPSAL
jgi:hypothetical protein